MLCGTSTDAVVASVILPHYNDPDRLALCLKGLAAQTCPDPFEVIVVDNGSSVDISAVRDAYPQMRFLVETVPGSYSARNTGIGVARGAILAFIDADCVPEPDWLENAMRPLRGPNPPSFVGGAVKMITSAGGKLSAAEIFDLACGFPQRRFVEQVHFAMTANMVTTAETMQKVGLFATSMKSGGDREWGNRAWRIAGPGAYVAEAVVWHPTRATPADVLVRSRRVAGGERDRHPGWADCVRFCAKQVIPPRQAIRDILALDNDQVPPTRKLLGIAFAYRSRLATAGHRLRLQFGGESSRV